MYVQKLPMLKQLSYVINGFNDKKICGIFFQKRVFLNTWGPNSSHIWSNNTEFVVSSTDISRRKREGTGENLRKEEKVSNSYSKA